MTAPSRNFQKNQPSVIDRIRESWLWSIRLELALTLALAPIAWLYPPALAIPAILLCIPPIGDPVLTALRNARTRREWDAAVRDSIHPGAARPGRIQDALAGQRIRLHLARGVATKQIADKAEQLAACLHAAEVRITPNRENANQPTAYIIRRDPFHNATPTTWPLEKAETASVWDPLPFGTYETGEPAVLDTMGGHILIAGVTGSGKSVALNLLIAQTALDPTARILLLDPNLLQFSRWESCAMGPVIGESIEDATRVLQTVERKMNERFADLRAGRKDKVERGDETWHIFIDELAHYLRGKEGEKFSETLLGLIQRGRACGVRIIAATQRPSAQILDTDVRAQFSHRILFRVMEAETVRMAFGNTNAPAHEIPETGYAGVGYLGTERTHVQRFRSHFLPEPIARQIATRAAANRIDQELHTIFQAPTPTPPTPKAEQARAERHQQALLGALGVTVPGRTAVELARVVGAPKQQWYRLLQDLVRDGRVVRDGAGRPGDPFRYRLAVQEGGPVVDTGVSGEDSAV